MPRTLSIAKPALSSAALFAAAAGAALPAADAHAAFVDNTSWTINVSADPIGCPGTATVTATFRFKKAAWGGPLNAGTLDVRLYDADGDGLFGSGDDLIGTTTATWGNQVANFVDLTVTFEVECVQTDGGWCTIRGNAGTDDEGDPHEMYIYVEEPNSGVVWNNSWTSPKNQGNWIKYSFPIRCGCDQNAGRPAEYDIDWRPTGESSTVVSFDLPEPTPGSAPLEFFQAFFHNENTQFAPVEIVPLADGGRATDVFGELFVDPAPGGFFVSVPVADPAAASALDTVGFEIIQQQLDPQGYGLARIHHDPLQTFGFLADGTSVRFQPTDGEIPIRPLDSQPPRVDIELVQLDLVGTQPILVGAPGAATDNADPLLPGHVGLDVQILGPDGQPVFAGEKPVNPDGSFDFPLPPLPNAGQVILGATDAAGNRTTVGFPLFGDRCNIADTAPPFGVLDLNDLSAFITAFTNGSLSADVNGDGLLDLSDVADFINAFTAGCP